MTILSLTASPGHHEKTPGSPYIASVFQVFGTVLGRTRVEAKSLDAIRTAVAAFGAEVAAQHPGRSFTVLVSAAKGSRKPNGFDAANRGNGLGQEAWMQTVTIADRHTPGLAA